MELLWFNLSAFISSFFTCYIIKSFLVIKGKKWRSVILYIACFFLNGMIIYIGDPANMPPTFLLFVGALFLCCEGSAKKKLTLGITLSCAPFALNCLIDSFIRDFHYTTANLAVQFTKVLFWVLLWLFIRKLQLPNSIDLPDKYWNVLLLVACTPFLCLLTLILIPDVGEYLSPSMNRTIIGLLVVIILSIIGVLYAIYALYQAAQLEESKLLWEANDQYYRNLDAQMQQIRKLRHDINNHLQVLSQLPEQEIKGYVNGLLSDTTIAKPLVFCRDSVLNAIFSVKFDLMEKANISFQYEISLEKDIPLTPTDKCALISNLLDNAIEASLKLPNQRVIHCQISCAKGLFIIEMKNRCIPSPDTSFQTTKEDRQNHGFGMKSIRDVTNRNHGTIEITQDGDWFRVFLLFPITSEKL